MKWGRKTVSISLEATPEEGQHRSFSLIVEDDGPGIPEEKTRDALIRGRRLDETKPGTGLGLAIVADLIKEYGGSLQLSRSELGGLKVSVMLRRAQD